MDPSLDHVFESWDRGWLIIMRWSRWLEDSESDGMLWWLSSSFTLVADTWALSAHSKWLSVVIITDVVGLNETFFALKTTIEYPYYEYTILMFF